MSLYFEFMVRWVDADGNRMAVFIGYMADVSTRLR